jgi:translation initiation factor IF-2
MSKLRVYEVARDLSMDNKTLVALFQSVGITEVRNHMSAVAPEQIDRVKRHLEKQSGAQQVEERIRPTVVKRRGRTPVSTPPEPPPPAPAPVLRRAPERASAPQRPPPAPEAPPPPPVHAREPEVVERELPPAPPPAPVEAGERVDSAPSSVAAEVSSQPSVSVSVNQEPVPAPALEEPVHAAPPASVRTPAVQPAPTEFVPPPRKVNESLPSPAKTPLAAAAPSAESAAADAARARPRPKTGIEVWEGRAGVPMPQAPRAAPPRRVQYDAKSGAAPVAGRGPRPGGMMGGPGGRMGGPGGRNARHRGIGSLSPKRAPGGPPITQERSAHKKIVKIESSISLQNLAAKMGAKAGEVLMKLLGMGMTGININSNLDPDTAKIVANEFGWEVEDVAVSDEDRLVAAQTMEGEAQDTSEESVPRPPVVTVMGHVDHGKTSLLDYLRKSTVTEGEAGGITQHIGAYSVETARGAITFLDTPGHAAFTAMRARGAQTTDIVVLVVAADDGVMPQTKEAVTHARSAKVPIVVAVNKIDKDGAQPDRVRRELSELGLVPEEWGGDTLFCECSAVTGQGVDKLLENLVLQADLLELRSNPNKPASGVVIEAKLDRGQGPVATVLVQAGTLKRGDVILVGGAYGKIRAMLDDHGRTVNKAGPSTPVAVIGLSDVPQAGDPIHTVKSLKEAQEIAESRRNRHRGTVMSSVKKVSLEELARRMSQVDQLEVKLIIKADVQGSVEAISSALNDLSTEKVKVTIVHSGVGAITEGDVNLAIAAKAIVVGFNVRPAGKAGSLAQKEGIEIRQYSVIYDVTDDIKATMEGLLAPTLVEKLIGKAEVRKLFKVSKSNVIAGCMVIEGLVRRNAGARLLRDSGVIWQGKIASLKRFKDDAREVKEGFDCGISLEGFGAIEEGDIIEAMETEEVRQTL